MAKNRTRARCTACDHTEPKWVGRCPACGSWGTMAEEARPPAAGSGPGAVTARQPDAAAQPITMVAQDAGDRLATGIGEFDRVLGGGFVPGSVTLLGGEPGAGKSTLLLQAAHALATTGRRVLYVSAEESPGQVRLRADRLGTLHEGLLLAASTELDQVLGLVEAHAPDVLVLDSIQTVRHPDIAGHAGGTTQVRESTAALVRAAKARGMAVILVGHVTKEGTLAGPRVLEHLVDTVAELVGDRHHALRLLRATKNRFGAVGEVGCFEMAADGLADVADPGRLFAGETAPGTHGVALTVALEGERALVCEVQALVAPTTFSNPRRVASGIDNQRLALLLAVLEQRAEVPVGTEDVFVSTVGGLRLVEPALDLAVCLAVASSQSVTPTRRDTVAVGEVGLAGELRRVAQTERRLAEAARLGLRSALLPHAYDGPDFGLGLHRAATLSDAIHQALRAPATTG